MPGRRTQMPKHHSPQNHKPEGNTRGVWLWVRPASHLPGLAEGTSPRSPCTLPAACGGACALGRPVETSCLGSGLVSCTCKGDLEAGTAEDTTRTSSRFEGLLVLFLPEGLWPINILIFLPSS